MLSDGCHDMMRFFISYTFINYDELMKRSFQCVFIYHFDKSLTCRSRCLRGCLGISLTTMKYGLMAQHDL